MPAIVTVQTSDGARSASGLPYEGSPERPLSDDEPKFRSIVTPVLGALRTGELLERIWNIEQLADAGDLCNRRSRRHPRAELVFRGEMRRCRSFVRRRAVCRRHRSSMLLSSLETGARIMFLRGSCLVISLRYGTGTSAKRGIRRNRRFWLRYISRRRRRARNAPPCRGAP